METIAVDPYNRNFNALIYGNISSLYLKKGDKEKALKAINKSIDFDKNYAKGYFKRAEIQTQQESWPDAERDYRTANGLDSTLNLQGKIQQAQKKVKEYKKNIDFYKILGVGRDASSTEIKKAFRKLSLVYHPDKVTDPDLKEAAARKWLEISEASTVLQDPKKKSQYDQGVYDDGSGGGGGGGGSGFGDMFNMDDMGSGGSNPLFQMFFGGGSKNNFNFGQSGGGSEGFPRGGGGFTRR